MTRSFLILSFVLLVAAWTSYAGRHNETAPPAPGDGPFDCDSSIEGGSCVASCWFNDWQHRDTRCSDERRKFSFDNGAGRCFCCRAAPLAADAFDSQDSEPVTSVGNVTDNVRMYDAYNCDSYLTNDEKGSACWFNDWQHRDSRCTSEDDKWSFKTVYGKCYCCKHPTS